MDRIGTDESGKGSYFGPLVVAGVKVGEDEERLLASLGVRDSKKIAISNIKVLSEAIVTNYIHSIVLVTPKRYNELYSSMRSINGFLLWAHKTVIKNILRETECRYVVIDDFGGAKPITAAFPKVEFDIRKEAENDIAVAAASVIARDRFLNWFTKARREYGVDLPLGINDDTIRCGKTLVEKYGRDVLSKIAKLHFKTTDKILEE
jgi:ribonuclease HIII